MVRKTTISSVLSQDFGIEDFERGVFQKPKNNLKAFELSNKLGLLAPLADRYNTDPISFGNEAYNLLGEARQIVQFVDSQIKSINNRFAIAAEVKKNYGVEGFDPFAFGLEGFKEKLKAGFTGVVAVIKKIIQSITNWIRQVLNWVGSQFAKAQEKLVEKYGNMKLEGSSEIKAMIPAKKISSGTSLVSGFNSSVNDYSKFIEKISAEGNAFTELLKNRDADVQHASAGASISGQYISFSTYYGNKINVVKLGTASKIANLIVFGQEKPKKGAIRASDFLNKYVEWKTILSKSDLKATQELVKNGKTIIKSLNSSLKSADGFFKSKIQKGDLTDAQKSQNEDVKRSRRYLAILNNANRVSGLMAGTLYATFANYLKLRSYTASAVRALAGETKKAEKKK